MEELIKNIKKNKIPCYFISPHFDDAALSAGGLMVDLNKYTKVTVVTIFTQGDDINTFSAKKMLANFNVNSADILYKARKEENINAFRKIGINIVDLNYTEAIWRKIKKPGFIRKMLGSFLPEFIHQYPTYKLHIESGKISKSDNSTIQQISSDLSNIISSNSIIFSPYGVGGHVDHVAVRNAVEKMCQPVYWVDQPYAQRKNIKKGFLYTPKNDYKKTLIASYETQIKPLFGSKKIPHLPERYILNQNIIPAKIGKFTFLKKIKIDKPGEFIYALYQDNIGQKAFAKILIRKSDRYKYVKNELNTYLLLRSSKKVSNVQSPQLLASYEDKNVIVMLFENITGTKLSEMNTYNKSRVLGDVLMYMKNIDISKRNKKVFNRGVYHWVLLMPYVTFLAILKYPKYTLLFIRSFIYFIALVPKLITEKSHVLAHRDLGNWNIIQKNKKIYVFDFELASYAPSQLDMVVAALKMGSDTYVFNNIIKMAKKNYRDRDVFACLGICLALYDMTCSNGGDFNVAYNFLKFNLSNDYIERIIRSYKKLIIELKVLLDSPINYLFAYTLSNSNKVYIKRYNPESTKKAKNIIKRIHKISPRLKVHFIGSASLKIVGQKDIDLLIECQHEKFDDYLQKLIESFGQPTKKRREFIEWNFNESGHTVEISLIDPKNKKFIDRIKVYQALKNDSNLRSEYEILKRGLNGSSSRLYTKRRIQFFANMAI